MTLAPSLFLNGNFSIAQSTNQNQYITYEYSKVLFYINDITLYLYRVLISIQINSNDEYENFFMEYISRKHTFTHIQ